MECPDEDTFAQFLQGLAPPEDSARIEQHIDTCRRCAETSAEFGRLYATRRRSFAPAGADPEARRLVLLETLLAGLNVAWAVVALPIASWAASAIVGGPDASPSSPSTSLAFAWLGAAYVAAWGPLGAAIAIAGALGLARRRRWGLRLAYWHAVMSLPSVVLTPLAAFVLYRVARLAPRPPWPPRTGALSDSWNQA